MFFDALGRLALGQVGFPPASVVYLIADAGAYTITGNATAGRGRVAAGSGAYALSGSSTGFATRGVSAAGSYSLTGSPAGLSAKLLASSGAYALSGQPALWKSNFVLGAGAYVLTGGSNVLNPRLGALPGSYLITGSPIVTHLVMLADVGRYTITPGYSELRRTGGEYDQVYGGIGHYLEEVQRLKQLDAITRKVPPPVVRQSRPLIEPRQPVPVAQPQPFDFQALADQAIAQQDDGQSAILAKRRKREAEILLLLA
ncbi:hypothetical protein AB7714_28300 [Tardiphaga sp. 1201_B9_N1_1]|uniref:hypothetical protein n=1 Tax=unclassified Tardiphaga TaxID=2631404 RepID=UPI003F26EDDF